MKQDYKRTAVISDTQPVAAEGLAALIGSRGELDLVARTESLSTGMETVRKLAPSVWVVDKSFGPQLVIECLGELRSSGLPTAPVVWGGSMTDAEALRFVQVGARGVIRKSAALESVLACLRAAAVGNTWVERELFPQAPENNGPAGPSMTPREMQILQLVSQGLKNREIAAELGIRPGTVKVHLKHIFEKTGARGRYGLALASLDVSGREGRRGTSCYPDGRAGAHQDGAHRL